MRLKSNNHYKFEDQVSLSAKQALITDEENKDHLWEEAIRK